eukprot:m.26864 g.26864  ORF g.26864 m.26864 type:complete len:287 (+) comp10137_c0_seq1:103-963(+)
MMTLHSSAPLVVSLVAVLLTAAKGTIDPQYAINMTIYHVNELNFTKGTLVNMDTADVYGDLYFDIRAYVDPIACSVPVPVLPDCTNPEIDSNNLGITEVVVEVDSRFSNYSRCNVINDTYSCECIMPPPLAKCGPTVGLELVAPAHEKPVPPTEGPNYLWWQYNLAQYLGGKWFSFLAEGQCSDAATEPCYWRVVDVKKRVSKQCSDHVIQQTVQSIGSDCFSGCQQPLNTSSTCWINCFYSTLMGPESANTFYRPEKAINASILHDAFLRPFASTNQTEGGCPSI